MNKLLLAFALVCSATLILHAADSTTDYKTALDQAKTQNKLVLLYFTGSDWCPNCKSLEEEVFSKPAFMDFAAKNYVMVTVDFPHTQPQPDNVKKQNLDLGTKFDPEALFPVLIVLSPDGKELGRKIGYKTGSGPDAIIPVLKSFHK